MLNFSNDGSFFIGCNYWASHSGTAMWSDWRPDVIEADFTRLAEANIRVLRVFPLWPDFQPITLLRGYAGGAVEYRFGEAPLPADEMGRAGVSAVAMSRFELFAGLAHQHDLKLIVGLVTGWMSGRLFVPPALEGLNVITDPVCLMWQVRLVSTFVRRFKSNAAIVAWDLGNECNCMSAAPSQAAAWAWTATITHAIKAQDTTRPVISGMHSLKPEGTWRIQDQAELTDVLTTHPYPYFTPHCDQDPLTTIRTELHSVAETLYYRGIGGKPCFVEEIGTLGPMFADEEGAAAFARAVLFGNWAHGGHGLMWWCAHDQNHLVQAPYDWQAVERELGLFRQDGSAKPVLVAMNQFAHFVENLSFGRLPERLVDGVCIVSSGQDAWGAAYGAFVLAKQAGLDLEFRYTGQPLPDSGLYLLPSLKGDQSLSRSAWAKLLEKVQAGAALYLSLDNAVLSPFKSITGLEVVSREKTIVPDTVTIAGLHEFVIQRSYKLNLRPVNCDVLGTDQDGAPAFTCAPYGRGKIFCFHGPLETFVSNLPGAFHAKNAQPYWSVYRELKNRLTTRKVVDVRDRCVGVTEHPMDADRRIVVVQNYRPEPIETEFSFPDGLRIEAVHYGSRELQRSGTSVRCSMGANDAVVFTLSGTDSKRVWV